MTWRLKRRKIMGEDDFCDALVVPTSITRQRERTSDDLLDVLKVG
jgi:hypothetical protein